MKNKVKEGEITFPVYTAEKASEREYKNKARTYVINPRTEWVIMAENNGSKIVVFYVAKQTYGNTEGVAKGIAQLLNSRALVLPLGI